MKTALIIAALVAACFLAWHMTGNGEDKPRYNPRCPPGVHACGYLQPAPEDEPQPENPPPRPIGNCRFERWALGLCK